MTAQAPIAPLVFITGASSGIGRALAAEYAGRGWRLALVARRGERLKAWAREQDLAPSTCLCIEADVRDPLAMRRAATECLTALGLPDLVVANAGISVGVDVALAEDVDVFAEVLDTNVLGMVHTFQPFVSAMTHARRGVLVGVASVASLRGLPGHAAYCASKAAVLALCESMRVELQPSGVRVLTLLPGFVATPLTRYNPYRMPFLMSAEEFARRAADCITKGAGAHIIPWPMAGVGWLMRRLPDAWWDRLMAGRQRKPRRTRGPDA